MVIPLIDIMFSTIVQFMVLENSINVLYDPQLLTSGINTAGVIRCARYEKLLQHGAVMA